MKRIFAVVISLILMTASFAPAIATSLNPLAAMLIPPEQYPTWEDYYADFFQDSYSYCYTALMGLPDFDYADALDADMQYAFVCIDASNIPLLYVRVKSGVGFQFLFAKERGVICCVMEGRYRSGFSIMESGVIHQTWSNSAFESGGQFIKLVYLNGYYIYNMMDRYEYEYSADNNENGITEGTVLFDEAGGIVNIKFFRNVDKLTNWLGGLPYYGGYAIENELFWKTAASPSAVPSAADNATVSTDKLNVRTAPSTEADNAVGFIIRGDRVQILQAVTCRTWEGMGQQEWYYVRVPGAIAGYEQAGQGFCGYVMAEYITAD
ncbi:MAG: SH3 domain-containing protein [Oscillospiraceae bacterium]|jgi:hypothetical protein|nr:SH3 domain-containing protein [Oscillospiraceae bacterium]